MRMSLRFPGSSEHLYSPTPLAAQPAAVVDRLAALSRDELLPDTYAADRIRLLPQSPYRAFLYWSHARDPFAPMRRVFGAEANHYRLFIRFIELDTGYEGWHEAPPSRAYWFDVRPDTNYRAEVGLRAPDGIFIRLLASNTLRSPRAHASHVTDETPEFRVSAPEFAQALTEAGLAGDALAVALEAADEASHDRATRSIARALAGEEVPDLLAEEMEELRALLAALAVGSPVAELLRAVKSQRLARWLEHLMAEHARALDAERLLEILRRRLAFELEYEPYEGAGLPRLVRGASDVRMPAGRFNLWMPSMTAGLRRPPTSGRR